MGRLIDADTLMADLLMGTDCSVCPTLDKKGCEYDRVFTKMNFCEWIDEAPTVDAVPVRHGYWRHYEGMLFCSECGMEFYDDIMEYCGDNVPHFCPECGATMDGKDVGNEQTG